MLLYVSLAMPFASSRLARTNITFFAMANRFLDLGDTGWELFHRLDRDQVAYYLKRRGQVYRYTGSGACGV